jgi:protein-S-isoprenylcysteine O-methyltransferase Ste14
MGWLILSVGVWGIVHSILASPEVKKRVSNLFGKTGDQFYRLAYNLFSVISLMPSMWLWLVLPDVPVYQIPAPWNILALAGQALAILALVVGVLQTGVFSFVGLSQLYEGGQKEEAFITNGLYHWVRHPLYLAGLAFIWLTPVVSRNTLVLLISASLYLIVGALFEERKLVQQFGPAYLEYKKVTPMFIPGLVFRGNK